MIITWHYTSLMDGYEEAHKEQVDTYSRAEMILVSSDMI